MVIYQIGEEGPGGQRRVDERAAGVPPRNRIPMIRKFLNGLTDRDPADTSTDAPAKQDTVLPCIGRKSDVIPVDAETGRIFFDAAPLTGNFQASREEMAAADAIASIITSTLDIADVYDRFAGEAKKRLDIDRITIGVINHEAGSVSVKYSFSPGIPGLVVGDAVPLEKSNCQGVLADGSPLFRADIANDLRNSLDEEYLSFGLHSCAQAPLSFQGRPVGIIGLWSRRVGAYSPREQTIITRLADQIAPAVEIAELHGNRVRAEEALQAAARTAHEVNNPLAAIILAADSLSTYELSDAASADLKIISDAAYRAARILHKKL